MATRRKIALLGARGFEQTTDEARVDSFSWDRIESISNLRDYDSVVLNLLSASPGFLSGRFERILNPFVASEILEPGGEIIVIGDPRFAVPETMAAPGEPSSSQVDPQPKSRPFLHWTCLDFAWDDRPGDTVSIDLDWKRQRYETYLSRLKRWNYSLAQTRVNDRAVGEIYDLDKLRKSELRFSRNLVKLATNRYNNALAFEIFLRLSHEESWGPIVFLPQIALSEDETLNLVLKDLCGVEGPLPEPQWVAEMQAPGQQALDVEIAEGVRALNQQLSVVEAKKADRAARRQVLRLLYDKGPSLEAQVRMAFRELGAHVEDPSEPGKEDGWVTVEVGGVLYEGVLEITGTRATQFGEDKLRQLLDWIHRGVELRKKRHKGIFVGAAAIDRPPAERPYPFSPSWETSAKLHGIAAVKCEDLYALLASLHGEERAASERKQRFWRAVFETNGFVDVGALLERHTTATDTGVPRG